LAPGPVINCCTNDGWSAGVPAAAAAPMRYFEQHQITSLRGLKLDTPVHFSWKNFRKRGETTGCDSVPALAHQAREEVKIMLRQGARREYLARQI